MGLQRRIPWLFKDARPTVAAMTCSVSTNNWSSSSSPSLSSAANSFSLPLASPVVASAGSFGEGALGDEGSVLLGNLEGGAVLGARESLKLSTVSGGTNFAMELLMSWRARVSEATRGKGGRARRAANQLRGSSDEVNNQGSPD